ncbi:uncharacterized protein C05D11.1-like [Pseudomyrmex gracilis]|uniref:uncharacterized protein C05D11.1-like n=1 Tax=Pseudomyrmex gracilis TaxID=219809 RepID=UPI000994DB24|nr:uncharacterized protein C05D11.1-like [Pseudomyrmex gracilis]
MPRYTSNTIGEFEQICSLMIEDTIPFYMYKSLTTGITICFAELEGPFVSSYFNFATKTHNNDGLPYALCHLIFTGSKNYPYKDVMKKWIQKCEATVTATIFHHRTCYQVKTPCTEAFFSLLPVYLDHIFYPTLTTSAYLTEIHHINGKGMDAGDLYCERKYAENTLAYLIEHKIINTFYDKRCGFTSHVKGVTKNLRESTNNKKVKNYHKKFYRPENLTIFIAGQVKHNEVFLALMPLEQKLLKRKQSRFRKPWRTPTVPFKKSKTLVVYYPHIADNDRIVNLIWKGPFSFNQRYEVHSCLVLWNYLISKSNLLYKTFRELSIIYVKTINRYYYQHQVTIFYFCLSGTQLTREDILHMRKY